MNVSHLQLMRSYEKLQRKVEALVSQKGILKFNSMSEAERGVIKANLIDEIDKLLLLAESRKGTKLADAIFENMEAIRRSLSLSSVS